MTSSKRLVLMIVLSAALVAVLIGWFVLDSRFDMRDQEEQKQEAGDNVSKDAVLAKVIAKVEQARRTEQGMEPSVKEAIAGFDIGIEAEITSTRKLEWRAAYDSLLREIASGKPNAFVSSGKNIVYLMNVYLYHESSERQQYSAAILYNLALTNRFAPEGAASGFPKLSEYEWLKSGLFHVSTSGYASESRRMGIETYAIVFGMDKQLYSFIASNYRDAVTSEKQSYIQAAYYSATGRHHTDEKRKYVKEMLRIAVNDPDVAISERAKSLVCASGNDADRFDLLQDMKSECDRQ